MKFEFNQGVPDQCIEWLWANVGRGNIFHSAVEPNIRHEQLADDDWHYKRVRVYPQPQDPFDLRDMNPRYVPTIFIDNEKLAVLFALRWV